MTFTIVQTQTTPSAEFRDGYLLIKGKSVPFDHPEIYDVIRDRLIVYGQNPEENTMIDIRLTAINGVSKRSMIDTFKFLENADNKGTHFKINWFYQPEDEDILELGEIFQTSFNLDIDLKISA